jgi:hypothetical protein
MFFKKKQSDGEQDSRLNQLVAAVRGVRAIDFDSLSEIMKNDKAWHDAVISNDYFQIMSAYLGALDGNDDRIQKSFDKLVQLADELGSTNFTLYVQVNKAEHLVQCRKILQYRLSAAIFEGKPKDLAEQMLELLLKEPASLVNIGC